MSPPTRAKLNTANAGKGALRPAEEVVEPPLPLPLLFAAAAVEAAAARSDAVVVAIVVAELLR